MTADASHIVARCPSCGEPVGQALNCPVCARLSPLDTAFNRLRLLAERSPGWKRKPKSARRDYEAGQDRALPLGDR